MAKTEGDLPDIASRLECVESTSVTQGVRCHVLGCHGRRCTGRSRGVLGESLGKAGPRHADTGGVREKMTVSSASLAPLNPSEVHLNLLSENPGPPQFLDVNLGRHRSRLSFRLGATSTHYIVRCCSRSGHRRFARVSAQIQLRVVARLLDRAATDILSRSQDLAVVPTIPRRCAKIQGSFGLTFEPPKLEDHEFRYARNSSS